MRNFLLTQTQNRHPHTHTHLFDRALWVYGTDGVREHPRRPPESLVHILLLPSAAPPPAAPPLSPFIPTDRRRDSDRLKDSDDHPWLLHHVQVVARHVNQPAAAVDEISFHRLFIDNICGHQFGRRRCKSQRWRRDSLEEALCRLGFSDVGVEGVAVGRCVKVALAAAVMQGDPVVPRFVVAARHALHARLLHPRHTVEERRRVDKIEICENPRPSVRISCHMVNAYLHNTRHASYSDGQVRGTSGQEVPASDGEDSSPSFGASLGGHPHDKWVLKKEKRKKINKIKNDI